MKNFKFKWLLLSIVLSIASINTAWAGDWEAVWNAYLKCNFNGSEKDFTGGGSYEYTFNPSMTGDGDGILYDLGTLDAGSFTITYLSWKIGDNWDCKDTYSYMWYNINDGGAIHSSGQHWDGQNNTLGYYPTTSSMSWEIANYTNASGVYVFKCSFYTHFHWDDKGYRQADLNNGGYGYKWKYRVAPPAVSTISVSATGALAGDGTEGNPYIVAYGGDLILDITGATQEHSDANSSAQYSVDGSSWGTETANTRKTIPNVTSTTTSNWMVYARFHNGTASLTGTQKGERIYYKAESRYNITATASPAAGGTVTPASATLAGQYSGGDITASPYIGYKFNGWTRTSGSGTFVSTSSEETKFKPTAVSTVQAGFVRRYGFIEGRFKVKNAARSTTTYTQENGVWQTSATTIPMDYDDTNHWFYKHTYCTPAELAELIGTQTGDGNKNPYFFVSASTASASVTSAVEYWATSNESNADKLLEDGESGQKGVRTTSGFAFTFMGNDDESGYAVIYCNKDHIWYKLEQTLNYAAGEGSGAAPAETYHMNGTTATAAAANTFTAPTGYHFDHWSGSDGENYAAGASVPMNSNITLTAIYAPNTYTINLDDNSASTAVSPSSVTATFDSNVLSAAITNPKNTRYVFAGWYNDEDCEGTQVIDGKGALCTGDGTYTDASRNWKKDQNNITLYAKWVAIATLDCWDDNTYTCGDMAGFNTPKDDATEWNTAANWGNSTLPDENTVVLLNHDMTVNAAHAKAKEVVLNSAKLTINPNMGLEVAGTITKADGSAPTASDLVLGSSEIGNATLIFNNSNSAAATVGMYSIASVVESTWNWQYMASPYVSASALHNYYGSYLYRWGNGEDETTGWFAVPNGGSVVPFVAYCITNKTAGTYYQMDGTMVATDGNDQTISVPAGKSWVVGNSWTAPIQIGQLQDDDFTGLLKNVYLYNTGMDVKGAASMVANPTGDARYAANTYISIPIHSATYDDITVVSSLQGFYVKDDPAVAGGGTLKLNYANHVRPSGEKSIQNGAMHAPKRIVADENEPNVLKIKVCGSKYDDRLVLLERADFSMGYDAGWDGDKMGNVAASPRITVEREDGTSDAVSAVPDLEGLAINFRAANTDNQQTLYFEYSDDVDPLYIVDVTNNEYTRVLTGNSYTFSTSDNEEHPRFILTRYGAPQITTGVDEVYKANSARKQMINGTLYIIRDGRIYNAEGALVK